MSREVRIRPLSAEAFAPFGDVIAATGTPTMTINRGMCDRYHNLAELDFGPGGRAAISVFEARPCALPLTLEMMERHPLGSQAFLPLSEHPFLVIVAPDRNGAPGQPLAFRTGPGEGVNYHRGAWHGVLTPLGQTARFAVVDRVGEGDNLEEHWFGAPYRIVD